MNYSGGYDLIDSRVPFRIKVCARTMLSLLLNTHSTRCICLDPMNALNLSLT